jgi:hypothetical protein
MGKIVKVTCDGCGRDLTTRTNCVDYRLVLASEDKPGHGAGVYTAMMIYPPVERSYYFCGLGCLDRWRDRERHESNLWREWLEGWKKEHGTWEGDKCHSWTEAPEEVRKACGAEFHAAALAAFPMKHAAD